MTSTTKVKVKKKSFLVENLNVSHITIIDCNFGRHKDVSTLKSDIYLGLAASVNYFG